MKNWVQDPRRNTSADAHDHPEPLAGAQPPRLWASVAGIAACWGLLALTVLIPPPFRGTIVATWLVASGCSLWRSGLSCWVVTTVVVILASDYLFLMPPLAGEDLGALLIGRVHAGLLASVALLAGALFQAKRYTEQHLQRTLLHLEQRVQERTEALSEVNSALTSQIEQRRKAEGEWQRLESELRQAHKLEAIGRLAGGVAHDFNNLLMVIQGYAELLLSRLPPDDPNHADLVEIVKASERGSGLTRQLLAFGRKQMLRMSPLDLNVVVRETSQMLLRVIGENIRLDVRLAPHPSAIEADPAQLEQVLVNIAVNARDAMTQGGVLTITVSTAELGDEATLPPGRYAQLRLSDNGCGMDEATMARVFEPFFTTKEIGKGSGLGLATVYGIVKQLGGHVEVESVPHQGTAFTIYFPETDKPIPVQEAVPVEPLAVGTETVLLVEDDEPVRALSRAVLQRHGYRILEAENPRRALAVAASYQGAIDLVVTDVVMPGMTGPEMMGLFEALRPDPRVVYVSGYATDALVGDGVLPDGVSLVQKPVAARDLLREVRLALDARPVRPRGLRARDTVTSGAEPAALFSAV
jgi:signal transduction histidine kinase/CheY-like chemotaxis protein